MYRLNKIVLLFLIIFVFSNSVMFPQAETSSPSNYTSLGDSIAFGMSATPNNGFVNLFHNFIKSTDENLDLKINNYGTPGDTSSDLLTKLKTNSKIQDSLKISNIITVSIGGNNLLQPVIATIYKTLVVNPKSPTLVSDINDKIKASPNLLTSVQSSLSSKTLQSTLIVNSTKFGTDWPQIISTLKSLAPTAQIYVMTIYNPVNASDPLYAKFEPFIQAMNGIINLGSQTEEYRAVDVYSLFKTYKDSEPLVKFDLTTGNSDPHPTTKGHKLISQAFSEAYKSHNEIKATDTSTKTPVIIATPKPAAKPKPTTTPKKVTAFKSKNTRISSVKYKIDNVKFTISIRASYVLYKTFKSNVKLPKGAILKVLRTNGTSLTSGKVTIGMKVKVVTEDGKTSKFYKIIK